MAKSKSSLATIVIIALLAVLLFALNPTMPDFQAWKSTQAANMVGGSTKDTIGVIKKGVGAMVGAMTGAMTGLQYTRQDFMVCSTYSSGGNGGELYLGVARLFVKLK